MNIFLKNGNQIRIGDFGLAKQDSRFSTIAVRKCEDFEIAASRQVGTPFYLAPELFSPGSFYSPKSDIWAVGVILYELLCLKYPF